MYFGLIQNTCIIHALELVLLIFFSSVTKFNIPVYRLSCPFSGILLFLDPAVVVLVIVVYIT